jgi:hypothetical protein
MLGVTAIDSATRRGGRLLSFALFSHALDISWGWLFNVVCLMGVKP